jgi:hypothetical protein
MTVEERQKVYKQLEDQKGRDNQILKAIEEMSELTKELTKVLGKDTYTNNKKICEEIADVKVVVEQLERFYDPEDVLVQFVMDYKLERLKMFYLEPLNNIELKKEGKIIKRIIIFNDKRYLRNKLNAYQSAFMLRHGGVAKVVKI